MLLKYIVRINLKDVIGQENMKISKNTWIWNVFIKK